MFTNLKLGFASISIALVLAGCGGVAQPGDLTADQDLDSAKEDSARKQSHPELYACQTDDDCVAVEKAGCCPNGFLAAVNKDEVKSYDTIYACTNPPASCPFYVVHDTRVAQCDYGTHQCHMIDPSQIVCGGFIAPARQHQCPAGYQCNYAGHLPDVGGSCTPLSSSN